MLYILSGAGVGFAIGLTGVGGGSLMTPLLLLFGYPPAIAIGTDLIYAGLTKASGVYFHHIKGSIRWRIVLLLAAGSIPASIMLNLFIIDDEFRAQAGYEAVLTLSLGIMLVLTALVILFQDKIRRRIPESEPLEAHHTLDLPSYGFFQKHENFSTLLTGILLGICVTLSSVGAGAFGAAVLFILYPRIKAVHIIGTDIAHAVPLTLVAGLGYLYYGLVDFRLLVALLIGSLPGIYVGTHMGAKLPDRLMRSILALLLFGLGLNFVAGGH
ncbi:MAG: sulfite exporter TauE/SafE family protein [Pseudohongiellaceae bacterium]